MKQTNEQQPDPAELEEAIDEQAAAWFARLRAPTLSPAEKAAFAAWRRQSPAHQRAFDEICLLWGDVQLRRALLEAEKKLPSGGKPARRRLQSPLLLAACLTLMYFLRNEAVVFMRADYAAGIGKRQTVRLEDGSSVMLNSGSAIAVAMESAQRNVELLQGEAFFAVEPDAQRPFVVYAKHSTTRVLGTRFFVHNKSDSDEVKVLSGKVRVTGKNHPEQSVLLLDNGSVSANRDGLGNAGMLHGKLTTSWVDGYLVFQDAALADVIEQIQRYRSGVVIFKDDSLRQYKINGRINLHDPKHILDALEKSLTIKFTHLTDWLVIIG